MRVCAAIATHNRTGLLVGCVHSLLQQTHPVSDIVIADTQSSEDPEQALRESGLTSSGRIHFGRLPGNFGDDYGVHGAMALALRLEWDWLFVLDDDNAAEPSALAALLASEQAQARGTAMLTSAVVRQDGNPQVNHCGDWDRGWQPLGPGDFERPRRIGWTGYGGSLVRRETLKDAGLPDTKFAAYSGDLDWSLRVGRVGELWLIPAARVLHFDNPSAGTYKKGLLGKLAMARRPMQGRDMWKYVYGFRGYAYLRKQEGEGLIGFAVYLGLQLARVLLFNPDKLERARLFVHFGLAGRRGEFRTTPPDQFIALIGSPGAARQIAERALPVPAEPQAEIELRRL
jgi:rhamnopyranosyl-N-acetylglucosaminyl-diphospho-decaprenol beta-1,3/1,4-galactofuranosyltransferase